MSKETNLEVTEPTEEPTEQIDPKKAVPKNDDASLQDPAMEDPTSSDDGGDAVDESNPNAEAAKYRKRLRETEAERDKLAARVESYQRREVEQYAAHLQKPEAIWKAGLKLSDLLDDDGNIDPERAQEAITTAASELGLAPKRRPPLPHPAQQGTSGIPGGSADDLMAQVIAGKVR